MTFSWSTLACQQACGVSELLFWEQRKTRPSNQCRTLGVKREQDNAELGATTDANHTVTYILLVINRPVVWGEEVRKKFGEEMCPPQAKSNCENTMGNPFLQRSFFKYKTIGNFF